MKRSLARLLAAAIAVCPAAADAGAIDGPALQAYTTALSNYVQTLTRYRLLARGNFGKPRLTVTCSYCGASFLGICSRQDGSTYDRTFPTGEALAPLTDEIRTTRDGAAGSIKAAADLRQEWDAQSRAVTEQFAATERALSAEGGGSRQAVADSAGQLVSRLDAAADWLGTWTRRLSLSIDALAPRTSRLRDASARARERVSGWIDETRRKAKKWRCQDGLDQQLADYQGGFDGRMEDVDRSLAPAEAQGRDAAAAGARLLGGIVSSRTAIAGIRDKIATLGQGQQSAFMRDLRFKTSAKEWRTVAADAAAEASP